MDLKSSIIQGMQAPIPVQQVPEDLVPYMQSLQALKQHESKYKQLDRVDKLSKRQAEKMRKEIEKSKHEYYEGEDKTSSYSPFRKALRVKLADPKTPKTPVDPLEQSIKGMVESVDGLGKANDAVSDTLSNLADSVPSKHPPIKDPFAAGERMVRPLGKSIDNLGDGLNKLVDTPLPRNTPPAPSSKLAPKVAPKKEKPSRRFSMRRNPPAITAGRFTLPQAQNPYSDIPREELTESIGPRVQEFKRLIRDYGSDSPEVKRFQQEQGLFERTLLNKNMTARAEQDLAEQEDQLDYLQNQRDIDLESKRREETELALQEQEYLARQEGIDEANEADRVRSESDRADRDYDTTVTMTRDQELADSLFEEFKNVNIDELEGYVEGGRYPPAINRLIVNNVLPRLRTHEAQEDRDLYSADQAEAERQMIAEEERQALNNRNTAVKEETENRQYAQRFQDREDLETARRLRGNTPYLGRDYNERALTRYDRKPSIPEPSYSQYFSDRFQDLKDYGSELATDASRLGTRLLRPITVGAQGLTSDAIQNYDFVRDMVGKDTARKLNEELFYATGRGKYLDRMGLQALTPEERARYSRENRERNLGGNPLEPQNEEQLAAEDRARTRAAYRAGTGEHSLDSYIKRQVDEQMRSYDQDRPVPDPKDKEAYQAYQQDRKRYEDDALQNLQDFYGREGNQLGTGSIRTDNPYRDALNFTQDVFSDPRKFLDQAAMGAKEKFDDFVTDIPTSGNQVYNQLDANNPLRQFFEPEGLRDPIKDVTAIEQAMRMDKEVANTLSKIYPESTPQDIAKLIGEGLSPNASPTLKSKALEAMHLLEDQLVRRDEKNVNYFDRDEEGNYLREMTPEMRADFQQRDDLLRNSIAQINANTQFPAGTTMLDYASRMQTLNNQLDSLDPQDPRAQETEQALLDNIQELSPEQADQMLEAMGIVTRTTGRDGNYETIDLDNVKDNKSLTRYLY